MKIEVNMKKVIEAEIIQVHVKVVDSGHYTLLDEHGGEICSRNEGYVPSFFPGEHHGDYLILDIDLASGRIVNWKNICPTEIQEFVEQCNE